MHVYCVHTVLLHTYVVFFFLREKDVTIVYRKKLGDIKHTISYKMKIYFGSYIYMIFILDILMLQN